jgi:hypothetical protein
MGKDFRIKKRAAAQLGRPDQPSRGSPPEHTLSPPSFFSHRQAGPACQYRLQPPADYLAYDPAPTSPLPHSLQSPTIPPIAPSSSRTPPTLLPSFLSHDSAARLPKFFAGVPHCRRHFCRFPVDPGSKSCRFLILPFSHSGAQPLILSLVVFLQRIDQSDRV